MSKKVAAAANAVAHNTYTKRELAGYLTGLAGQNIIYNIIATGLAFYFQSVIFIPAIACSLIFALARVWDAINDPMMGTIVDKTRTKWGKCKPYLLFLLGKGLGESQYPRLISGSDTLLEVLNEVKVKALHPDTVVTFFVEAAIAEQNEKRIQELIDLGFDITAVNTNGKTACEMLHAGIESYNYGNDKRGKNEKQRDLQGLKTLERFYSEYTA